MDRRVFAVILFAVACDRKVEDGVFAPTGSPTSPATAASGDGNDDDARGTSEGSTGVGDGDGDGESTAASDPTFGDPESSGTNPASTDPTDDPTDDPSDPDPTDDPSNPDPSESTGDPTGVDPTGADPTGAATNCCDVQLVPGCDDAAIEGCVCGLDAFCCDVEWDDLCVGAAFDCGAPCDGGGGGGGEDCCVPGDAPGCSDPAVEACVCGFDPFCCDTEWDDTCATEAILDCLAPC